MSTIREITMQVKSDSFKMAALDNDTRNKALQAIIDNLQAHKAEIFAANAEDLNNGEINQIPQPVMKRLKFDEAKLADVCAGMKGLQNLPDPLFRIKLERQLDEGLIMRQVTCPIGVIGVIFESRPDALVQIAALCLKSGNCAILKGGSEAAHTNRVLFDLIHEAGVNAGIPEGFLTLIENRADIGELLKCDEAIDLLIPRGSNAFVQYIMNNSKIPVMGHADGVCHIYVDEAADLEKALPIIMDAKTQYVAACNTVETLLVHNSVAAELLPKLSDRCKEVGVKLNGCPRAMEFIEGVPSTEEDYSTEYVDYILTVKIVDSLDEAIAHINHYGSHHTDAILTENNEAAEKFMLLVDSAGVYQNCSTRFADGFRYGFGAEVGISTGKLHARGPVGLDGLVTYKYKIFGHGQIVGDYASGKSTFKFKDL